MAPLAAMKTLLDPECILLGARAHSVQQALETASDLVHRRHGLRRDKVAQRLMRREQRGSTALGHGLALPHADAAGLGRPVAAFVRLDEPVPFDAPDGQPVRDLLVLVVPRPAQASDFSMLTRYRRLLSAPAFRESLRACADEAAIWRLFEAHEWR
jgi:PTS system nitrogen regulatory IIA component